LSDEQKLLKMGGWLRMGAGLAPLLYFCGKRKKQDFVWQIGKFRLSLQLKYKNNNNIY
jgi:hypothetical protein